MQVKVDIAGVVAIADITHLSFHKGMGLSAPSDIDSVDSFEIAYDLKDGSGYPVLGDCEELMTLATEENAWADIEQQIIDSLSDYDESMEEYYDFSDEY